MQITLQTSVVPYYNVVLVLDVVSIEVYILYHMG